MKDILSLVLITILSSLAFGIFTVAPSFSQYATLQNYADTNPSINCSPVNMENDSVHDAQRTDSGSIIIEYRYSPSNPHSGCPMEWRLSFEKSYDYTQRYSNVQYDIFTVDDQGKKLSSGAQDNGKTNFFASRGDDDLKVVLKETTPLTHIVIAVLGMGSDGSLPDTSLAGVVKFDINTSSNQAKNNDVRSSLETQLNLARSKIAATQANPHLGTGLYNNWCQPMKSVFFSTGNITLDSITLQVQVAYCDEQQRRGLMFQNHLPYNQGMLFVSDQEQIMPIWMLNMQFPLDVIWFDKDGKVIHIEKNVQPCKSALETGTCLLS